MPQNYANGIKQTLALTLPVLCPREPRPGGETCLYSYNCHFFVCFRTYLFVRVLFGKMLRRSTHEGRPDSVVEVWARSVHSGARGRRSKLFLSAGVDKRISRVSPYEAVFCTYVPVKCKILSQVLLTSCMSTQPRHAPQVDNKTCREHVTILRPISIGRQHRACVTRPSALYCCG